MKLREFLNEASTPMRAWSGKLKRIDAILGWMYDQNILTATDKKRKDTIFYSYYRYYNDGDMPRALANKGLSKWSNKEKVQEELEAYLEKFIKEMLAKYLPRVDRGAFRIDTFLNQIKTVQDVAARDDAHGLLTYWLKKVKIQDTDGKLAGYISTLQTAYDAARAAVNEVDPKRSNMVLSYCKQEMEQAGTWTKALDKKYAAVTAQTSKINDFLIELIAQTKALQKEVKTKQNA